MAREQINDYLCRTDRFTNWTPVGATSFADAAVKYMEKYGKRTDKDVTVVECMTGFEKVMRTSRCMTFVAEEV